MHHIFGTSETKCNSLQKQHHPISQTLVFKNGYGQPSSPPRINRDALATNQPENACHVVAIPKWTSGTTRKISIPPFRPHYVIYDNVVLTFNASFQLSSDAPILVELRYFMADDTIAVTKPAIKSCYGIHDKPLKVVRRSKIVKDTQGIFYSWKDICINSYIKLNGLLFYIISCEPATKQFLKSQGVSLHEVPMASEKYKERIVEPIESVVEMETIKNPLHNKIVLQFDAIPLESANNNQVPTTYKIFFYMEDNTIAVSEYCMETDRFEMLLKRIRFPKKFKQQCSFFNECVDIEEYYSVNDLYIGATILGFGRKFLITNCNKVTKHFIENVLRRPQAEAIVLDNKIVQQPKLRTPKYLGLGTPEDSLASHLDLIPREPKIFRTKYIDNINKHLRYKCILDSPHPEDVGRQFIVKYSLSTDMITITEPPIDNSGIRGGLFLKAQRIVDPDSDPNLPEYYTSKDLYIGGLLKVFNHRFRIKSADLYAYQYMLENRELFDDSKIDALKRQLQDEGHLVENICQHTVDDQPEEQKQINSNIPDASQFKELMKVAQRCDTAIFEQ